MKKAPLVSALRLAGFEPYITTTNKDEFILNKADGAFVYVQFSKKVISATSSTNTRLLTTYFSSPLEFLTELGVALDKVK